MEEQDWDLHAVVRSCAAANTTATTSTAASSATTSCNFQLRQDDENNSSFCSQDLHFDPRFTQNIAFEELHELCKPFINTESSSLSPPPPPQPPQMQPLQPKRLPLSPLSVLGGLQKQEQQQQKPLVHQLNNTRPIQPKRPFSTISTTCTSLGTTQSPRTKRRKNQMKKVCQVAADALSSDMWSWRKYGQKPIKGSPYPRGYYKCSTSKGCLARKQVERNRSDPNMFIVTYTAEHNHPMPTHRNSLAGVSRHKTAANSEATTTVDPNKPTSSSPVSSPATNSPAPENQESSRDDKEDIFEDDDDEFGLSNMALDDNMGPDDDFFEGLEELEVPAAGDSLPDNFPASLQFPWLGNNAATTAAGGS